MASVIDAPARAQKGDADLEHFRLRRLVERFGTEGELEVVSQQVDLVDIGARLDGNPKAVHFRAAGPEKAEVVGNVLGSRRRIALGFGVSEKDLRAEVTRRLEAPIPPVEVSSSAAPVPSTGREKNQPRDPLLLLDQDVALGARMASRGTLAHALLARVRQPAPAVRI